MKCRNVIFAVAVLVSAVAVVLFLHFKGESAGLDAGARQHGKNAEKRSVRGVSGVVSKADRPVEPSLDSTDESVGLQASDATPAPTDEERREAEESALVDAFDGLTDKWMEPKRKGVSMEDVEMFSEQFRKVPKDRKEECLHRALNLIPDENVMLLVGILMDPYQDKEIVELVFHDVLNRDESVKKPIMQQIIKDKSHPCWADAAWILDVTGELPKKK